MYSCNRNVYVFHYVETGTIEKKETIYEKNTKRGYL